MQNSKAAKKCTTNLAMYMDDFINPYKNSNSCMILRERDYKTLILVTIARLKAFKTYC